MTITANTKDYEYDTHLSPDRVRYTGTGETLSAKDRVDFGRTRPKATADYPGNARSQVKLVRTGTDGTNPVGDMIADLKFQIPATVQSSEIDTLVADIAAFAAHAVTLALAKNLDTP